MGKVTSPSSSASFFSSKPSEKKENGSAGSYIGKLGRKFQSHGIEPSRKERAVISRGALQVLPQGELHLTASTNSRSVSAVVQSKRKADDSKHGPESPVTKTSRAISDAEKAQKARDDYWQNREENILSDLPGSSGRLGPCLQLLAESSNATVPPFVNVITAGALINFASPSGGIMSFLDEHLLRGEEGPTFMD